MVLEYSHRATTFRDFRGEASGSPSLARSDLAVPNQGLRRGAFATRHAAQASGPPVRGCQGKARLPVARARIAQNQL